MAFQTPITIKEALEAIHRHDYALPAIQREFVWSQEQIELLFDSLMRGYPIGSFLFWKVEPANSTHYVFHDFIQDYHGLTGRHCPILNLPAPRPLTAILDGQQRLTSLNIGLHGSHAALRPRGWRRNLDSYVKKFLFLDLTYRGDDRELEYVYRFKFLTPAEATAAESHWYRVGDVRLLNDGPPLYNYIRESGLANHEYAHDTLWKLRRVVHEAPIVAFYEEKDQDLDKVLHIFIRVISQGEPLTYSDLLLSIATAQWEGGDAREAIYAFVDEINQQGQGFGFSKISF